MIHQNLGDQRHKNHKNFGNQQDEIHENFVTDSIGLPSASRIRNTLYLFEILSFICWRLREHERKRKRETEKKRKAQAIFMNFSMQTENFVYEF